VRLSNQFDEPQFIKVASELKVPDPSHNVEHQATGVIRGSEVPAGGGWIIVGIRGQTEFQFKLELGLTPRQRTIQAPARARCLAVIRDMGSQSFYRGQTAEANLDGLARARLSGRVHRRGASPPG
jgi:hypothetical protein